MATITLKGSSIHTSGELPKAGSPAPNFELTSRTLEDLSLESFGKKRKLLNIFPSIDTSVCQAAYHHLFEQWKAKEGLILLNISADLPFALDRFCDKEAIVLSAFRSSFAADYGVEIVDGPLRGLCARAVVLLNEENKVVYTELVPEIAQEPNYAEIDKIISN